MFEEGDSLCLEASVAGGARSELRDLAASVILQGLYDLSSNDWRARQSAVRFIRRDGGGIWADYLELDRELIRKTDRPMRSRGGRKQRNSGADVLRQVLVTGHCGARS